MNTPTEPGSPGDTNKKPDWAKTSSELERERRQSEGLPPMRRKWPWVVLILVVAATSGYFWYQDSQQTGVSANVEPIAAMQVNPDEMTTIAPQLLERRVKVIGTLDPSGKAQLSSQVGGRVEIVTVSPGDTVNAGDILVQVDVEALTLDLRAQRSTAQSTRSQLALAEAQLGRSESLVKRGVGTTAALDEARGSVASLQANLSALEDQVASAELRLRNATLRAPFDGIVSARSVEPGQYVTIGAPLVTVVDLASVEMQANAAVGSGALLKAGQTVTVKVDGIEDQTFEGVVSRINPVADEGTRTIPVYVKIDNSKGTLLGGMFASGQIVVDRIEQAIAVPTDSIRRDQQGAYVLRIENGKLLRQPIEIGSLWAEDMTRILSGLDVGQKVVTAPLPALHAGDAVELVEN